MIDTTRLDTEEQVSAYAVEMCNWHANADEEGEYTAQEIRDLALETVYGELDEMELDAEDPRYIAADEGVDMWRP